MCLIQYYRFDISSVVPYEYWSVSNRKTLYRMSKKSRPFLHSNYTPKIDQDFLIYISVYNSFLSLVVITLVKSVIESRGDTSWTTYFDQHVYFRLQFLSLSGNGFDAWPRGLLRYLIGVALSAMLFL